MRRAGKFQKSKEKEPTQISNASYRLFDQTAFTFYIQQNDIQKNDTPQNNIQQKGTQQYDIQQYDTQQN
jgi:hypothetical protein